MFAGAGLVFIVTGLICGFVRFRHCCRPFSEHEEYFYPARKQVAVFYAAVALSFPYILAPEDPAVWTYVRIWGIVCYPTGFALLVRRYFDSFGDGHKVLWGVFLGVPTLFVMTLLAMLFAGGAGWIAGHSRELCIAAGALSFVLTCVMAGVLACLKRMIDHFNTENYSNEEDFPYSFARMMVVMPFAWVAGMWAVFLSGNHWVKFAVDILASLWMVYFLCIILHPQRVKSPKAIDETTRLLERESEEEIKEIKGRRRFREPHLLKSEVLLDVGNGDMGKASSFISGVGYYNLVNMFRLEYARLYKEAHPNAKQEEIAEEAGFSSRTAYYKAKKYVGEIDPEIVKGVSLAERAV